MVANDMFEMIHDTRKTGPPTTRHYSQRRMPTTALKNDQWPYNPDDVHLEEPPPARSLPDPLPVPAGPVHRQGVLGLPSIHQI